MSEPVFLFAFAMMAGTAIMVARAIAGAISGRGGSRADIAHMKERVEQQAAALEDAQHSLAHQSALIAELQERLDFTERLLAQSREHPPLGPARQRE